MCTKKYSHSIIQNCYCMGLELILPRYIDNLNIEQIDALFYGDNFIEFRSYKTFMCGFIDEKVIHCHKCRQTNGFSSYESLANIR